LLLEEKPEHHGITSGRMKLKPSFELMCACCWFFLLLGIAISGVGQPIPKESPNYDYGLVGGMLIATVPTCVLFFVAGRKSVEVTEKGGDVK